MLLSDFLHQKLREQNLTAYALAKQSQVSYASVQRFMSDDIIPSDNAILLMSKALKLTSADTAKLWLCAKLDKHKDLELYRIIEEQLMQPKLEPETYPGED